MRRRDSRDAAPRQGELAEAREHNRPPTATQNRSLDESAGGGGCANEYERIDMTAGRAHSIQQVTYDEAGNLVATDLLGDMNCDGVVNGYDVTPFSLALSNPEAYAQQYPDCMLELGDINGDGAVNGLDLNAFVGLMGGNLMSARRYQYDEENRLTAVTEIDGTPLLEIEYDALGRRIASTEYGVATGPCTGDAGPVTVQTRHVYSGLNTVAEYVSCDDGANWDLGREFLWGDRPALDGPLAASQGFPEPLALIDYTAAGERAARDQEVLHYVRDALGSVVGLLDAGDPDATPDPIPPKMVERYDYDPYGKTYIDVWDGGSETWVRTAASAYGNPFGWTGQRYDAGVGMYHFLFRSYSPELGRWMQRDPLGYVDGPNLYVYALGNPGGWRDPLGLKIWWQAGPGATPEDMARARAQLEDAKTRRNPDGGKGQGVQDIERLEQDEEGGVVIVVTPGAGIEDESEDTISEDGSPLGGMFGENSVVGVKHDPDCVDKISDGVQADPESTLVHELRHAVQDRYGPRGDRKTNEKDATAVENEHRRNKKVLDQRQKYGPWTVKQYPSWSLQILLDAWRTAYAHWLAWRNFVGPLTPDERLDVLHWEEELARLRRVLRKHLPQDLRPDICSDN